MWKDVEVSRNYSIKPFGIGKFRWKPLNIPGWAISGSAEHDDWSNVGEKGESERIDTSSIIDFVAEPSYQGATIDNLILIDGKYYYKASVICQLLNDPSSSSKDYLKRVRGLSKYVDDRPQDLDIEDSELNWKMKMWW